MMKNKTKFFLAIFGIVINLVLLTIVAYCAENGTISEPLSNALCIFLTVLLLIICLYAGSLEHALSVYKCQKCKHIFKPTKAEYIFGAHIFTTRYLKCPVCGEKSWCTRRNDTNEG